MTFSAGERPVDTMNAECFIFLQNTEICGLILPKLHTQLICKVKIIFWKMKHVHSYNKYVQLPNFLFFNTNIDSELKQLIGRYPPVRKKNIIVIMHMRYSNLW